jgi:hypothetical protein
MKKIIPSLAILTAAALLTLPDSAAAQSQSAPKKMQRGSGYRYVDTSCHTYGGYGWGPYFGPCPYRGQVYAVQPGPPVFGPFLPFGPFW